MKDYEIGSLTITGFGDKPLPNTFFRKKETARDLAVLLPGLRYSADMPLLYYPTELLLQRNTDVLQVDADYTVQGFQTAASQKQVEWLESDARAAIEAGKERRDYQRLILVGKSIGTITLAQLAHSGLDAGTILIWLTPLLRQSQLIQAALDYGGPSFFISGSADPSYDANAIKELNQAENIQTLVIEGADHSLEIPGNAFESVNVMAEILQGIANFLDEVA